MRGTEPSGDHVLPADRAGPVVVLSVRDEKPAGEQTETMTPQAKFCRRICGTCPACVAALAAEAVLDAVYASLSDEDVNSLHRIDEDDPRGFALDSKGRP